MANNGMKKAMAAWCEVCPFCVVGRWFPKSIYSRLLGRWERTCPFCKAHREIKQKEKSKSGEPCR